MFEAESSSWFCPVPGHVIFTCKLHISGKICKQIFGMFISYNYSSLFVSIRKYFNFTCLMKIISIFPDDPADTGIFCKCVRYLVAAYFRRIPAFEIFFIILSVSTILSTSTQEERQKKIEVISVFGSVIAV